MAGSRQRNSFLPVAVVCIASGILLQLESLDIIGGVSRFWPALVLLLGTGQILLFFKRDRRDVLLLGIGVYLVCVSGLFFYCNFTSWRIMAHAWPWFLGFLGVACLPCALFVRHRVLLLGIALFLISAGTVFFLVFSISPRLWPTSLILFGGCIFVWRFA